MISTFSLSCLFFLGLLIVTSSKPSDKPSTNVDYLRWIDKLPVNRNPATDVDDDDDDDDDDEVDDVSPTYFSPPEKDIQGDSPMVDGRPPKSNKRLNACKNGNKFLKTKLKNQRHQYKVKLHSIKKLITEMFDESFDDPEMPMKNFCKENREDEEDVKNDAVLNDFNTGNGQGQAAHPCELTAWSEWNHLAFGTLERKRTIVREGCGCPSQDELVQVVNILPYLGNNTSAAFADPKKVGENFKTDFLNPFKNGNGNNGGGLNNGGGSSSNNGGNGGPNGGNGGGNNGGNGGSFNGGNGGGNNGRNGGTTNGGYGGNAGGNGGRSGTGTGVGTSSSIRDILMILDSSGSIESDDFDLMKEGLVAMVDLFCGGFGPGENNNRLALVQFASNVTVIHKFSDSQLPVDLKAKVTAIRHYKGNTCTGNALKKSMKEVFTAAGGMRDFTVKDTLIVTDGQSNCGIDIRQAAHELQQSSNVFALGVGIAGKVRARDEVKSVVSMEDPHHIFSLAKFSDFRDMVENLKHQKSASDPCLPIVSP